MIAKRLLYLPIATLLFGLALAPVALAQRAAEPPTAARKAGEGEGPFKRLVIRGATIIDGAGSPPQGPVDIVIEGGQIAEIRSVGAPKVPINQARRPQAGDKEIDAQGMYVMPGFIDLHVHAGGGSKNPAEYAYKLWLAHGVTTVRGVSLGGFDWALDEQARSARNEIVAPRIVNYQRPGGGWDQGPLTTPDKARAWVRWAAQKGIDGMKMGAFDPPIMEALLDEAKKHGLGSTAHLAQTGVARMNALDAARLGLGAMTHFYGLFESMYEVNDIQPWPVDLNYNDEYHRFGQVARQWNLVKPRGEKWNALLQEFLDLKFVIDPTMTIYEAGRDVMRARNADWHEKYTLPSLWDFYQPSREAHGSYWFDWTLEDEIAYKNYYRIWMQFLNDYKNAGGRVTTGSDAGFIYSTYGFGYVRELELLQEAGFHPLEVIRAATLHGAEAIFEPKGKPIEYGILRPGLRADLVIIDQNPLQNLKVLYGTGAVRLNDESGQVERVGGVKYTIKDGIIYDAKRLLADVAAMVEQQRRSRPVTTATLDGGSN
jgi:imidazolonepropionase-like amidohydrolase